ncbi:MAG TPA: GyrI-like domain-containing protein [Chitinophagaceae bacterium]|nr:GyrI-like domain-containing protein [Chitinophagaceae bacterium]
MRNGQIEYETVQVGDFYIVGISTITTNQGGQSAKDIGELWGRFYDEGVLQMIEERESDDIYSVYTDYESDFTGQYTCILGVRVNVIVSIPEGFVGRKIEGGNYLRVVARGSMPGAVFFAWTQIWQNDELLERKYQSDFEVYGDKATYGDEAEVDIYLSVK